MPQCPVCGGQEFDLLDGSYYCSECATQSQEMRLEELDDEGGVFGVKTRRIKTRVTPKDCPEEIDDEVWMTTDAFNLILFKQCQALITLGVDSTLKDMVFQLWVMYLRKCEKAFVNRRSNWNPKLPSKLNSRDFQVVLKKPVANLRLTWKGKTRKRLTLEPISSKDPKRTKELMEKKRLAALKKEANTRTAAEKIMAKRKWGGKRIGKEIDQLAMSNGNNPTSENTLWEVSASESAPKVVPEVTGECPDLTSVLNNEVADSTTSKPEKSKRAKQLGRWFSHKKKKFFSKVALNKFATRKKKNLDPTKCLTNQDTIKEPDVLTLEKLLAFPLLALRLLGSPVLVSDFARWIREGHIPYQEAYKLLPPSWTLYSTDLNRMNARTLPKLERLYFQMKKMSQFLGIEDPGLVSLKAVAARFYSDLNLPYELIPILMTVVGKFEHRLSKSSRKHKSFLEPVERNAAHCILIMLKLVLGLDGTTERDMSKAAQKRNLTETGNFFVWTDWECQTEMILQHLTTCCPQSFLFRLPNCIDSDSVTTHVQTNKLGRPPEGITKENKNGDCISHNRNMVAFRKTYTMLNKETNLWTNFVGRCASSFPLTAAGQTTAERLGVQLVDFTSQRFLEPFVPVFALSSGDVNTRYPRSFNVVCRALSANMQTSDLPSNTFKSTERVVIFGRQHRKQKTC